MDKNPDEIKTQPPRHINFKGVFIRLAIVLIIIILSFAGGIIFINSNKNNQVAPVMTNTVLTDQLQNISELATVKYLYTNMGKFEDSNEVNGIKIPFTTKSFILSYDGVIKAGIDASKLQIDVSNTVITVTMPSSQILSHEIDNDSVQVYDQSKNIFNQIEVEDYTAFCSQQESVMEQRAIDNGLLKEANEKAETVIKDILNANEKINSLYVIKFVYDT